MSIEKKCCQHFTAKVLPTFYSKNVDQHFAEKKLRGFCTSYHPISATSGGGSTSASHRVRDGGQRAPLRVTQAGPWPPQWCTSRQQPWWAATRPRRTAFMAGMTEEGTRQADVVPYRGHDSGRRQWREEVMLGFSFWTRWLWLVAWISNIGSFNSFPPSVIYIGFPRERASMAVGTRGLFRQLDRWFVDLRPKQALGEWLRAVFSQWPCE
jgi:hypothetical protein